MAVTFTKTPKTIINPFDDTATSIIRVCTVKINNVSVPGCEFYSFDTTKTDAEIQAAVEADLTAKGYTI